MEKLDSREIGCWNNYNVTMCYCDVNACNYYVIANVDSLQVNNFHFSSFETVSFLNQFKRLVFFVFFGAWLILGDLVLEFCFWGFFAFFWGFFGAFVCSCWRFDRRVIILFFFEFSFDIFFVIEFVLFFC